MLLSAQMKENIEVANLNQATISLIVDQAQKLGNVRFHSFLWEIVKHSCIVDLGTSRSDSVGGRNRIFVLISIIIFW